MTMDYCHTIHTTCISERIGVYLVHPDASLEPKSKHAPPMKPIMGETPSALPHVPERREDSAPPNSTPPTYTTYTNRVSRCLVTSHALHMHTNPLASFGLLCKDTSNKCH